MDLTALFQAVFSIGNLPVSVLLIVCGWQAWLLYKWRQETREDQKAIVEALNKNTEAMAHLRIAVAANTGRA